AAVRLAGSLNVAAVEEALNEILRRHEALRTRFCEVDGRAAQVIEPWQRLSLGVENLGTLAETEREAEMLRLAREEAHRPFDLSSGPLLRARLLRMGDDEHVVLLTIHHIVGDEWSMGVMVRELAALYESFDAGKPSPLPELMVQYADFAAWQRGWFQGEVAESQLDYWRGQLDGMPTLEMPVDKPRPSLQTYEGATLSFELSPVASDALAALSRREGVTLFMSLLAVFQTLLHRYTGQDDIVLGTPIAGRSRLQIESLIGFFVNTLVLRGRLDGNPTFRELLRRTREMALGAYAHQDLPFEKLVEELQPERDLSRTPLFQTVFVLQSDPVEKLDLPGLKLNSLRLDSEMAKFDLLLSMVEGAESLQGFLNYNTELFEHSTIKRMVGHFQTLIESILANPDARLSDLQWLTSSETEQLVREWNETEIEYPDELCLHQLFERQAELSPHAVAVVFQDEQISYAELNRKANQLARYLQTIGVGPESLVGICVERGLEMIVGLLGILKAGGAYLPLDPHYPQERLKFIYDDARISLLLTQGHLRELSPPDSVPVLCLDTDWDAIAAHDEENFESGARAENLAYMIYTSGSTGQPKGVLVTHANVARLFAATHDWFHFDHQDVWTLFHSYTFDFSVWEIWGALLHGGRLVVVPYMVSRSPEAFYELLCNEGVTVLNQTPSMFRQVIAVDEAKGAQASQRLRLVIFGGEALEFQSLRPWIARHGDEQPQLVNMYGITETTVHVTYKRVRALDLERRAASEIGRRIPDLQLYILDERQQPVAVGVHGEICVGGSGVARGYLNRPELTVERFIADPFGKHAGGRLYRSGDKGRYLSNGEIEYLGRFDQQVKVRGFRVEPGEIEAVLGGHEAVRECVLMALEDVPGDRHLVAYAVMKEGQSASLTELRGYLKERLPDYMIPQAFVMLDSMPLTSNGKLDRAALPAPDRARPDIGEGFVAPVTIAQQALANIWGEVLRVEQVGLHDNFFALGGDSIRSIKVRSLAEQQGLSFSLQQLFQYQTIFELTRHLNDADARPLTQAAGADASLISEEDRLKLPADVSDAYPLAMLQAGML
ncbi:MAG: hypothetical protein QOD00_45, partial [Blastocatellia bacterium]|nr:hypothetical protein [Blastocatellia bacterium]